MHRWPWSRYVPFALCVVVLVLALGAWNSGIAARVVALLAGGLVALGVLDLAQKRSTLRRNYPVSAHVRFLFEFFRPMLRQYVVESDTDEVPFSHAQRGIVKHRSLNAADVRPFGSLLDMYAERFEWLNHSLAPTVLDSADFRITIGGPQCTRPYSASVFNISAMSFGSISPNAVRAIRNSDVAPSVAPQNDAAAPPTAPNSTPPVTVR